MSSTDRLAARIHEGELDWISRVVDHLADDELKLVYADWLFPGAASLARTTPPRDFTEGNELMDSRVLLFEETLDLPEAYAGPWSDELKPDSSKDYSDVLDHFRSLNFDNLLGYGRATTGNDPTPNRHSRHLIILENSVECRLHIQIDEKDFTTRHFDAIKLEWVDFD